jgi:hypothetical protein
MRERKIIRTENGFAYIEVPSTGRVPWLRSVPWQAWVGIA